MKEKIIRTLKLYPEKSILQVSAMLQVDSVEVAQAQRDYYRPYLPAKSKLWDLTNNPNLREVIKKSNN